MSNLLPSASLRSLLLAASASLALAAFVPAPVQAAPPDSEDHQMTTDSPELAADRARALQRVEQDHDAALQQQERELRREDAAAAEATHSPAPLSGSTSPDDPMPESPAVAADPAPLLNDRANAETERSGATAAAPAGASATNWSEDGKSAAQSGSSAGAPLSRTPAPGGVPGENAADPLAAPRPAAGEVPTTDAAQPSTPAAGEGAASVIPDAARVDQ